MSTAKERRSRKLPIPYSVQDCKRQIAKNIDKAEFEIYFLICPDKDIKFRAGNDWNLLFPGIVPFDL